MGIGKLVSLDGAGWRTVQKRRTFFHRRYLEGFGACWFFEVWPYLASMTHVASGFRPLFSIKTIVFEHLSDLHVLFADSELFFAIFSEVLDVVAGIAGYAQFAGDHNHLFTNFFLLDHEFADRL